ncbi:hypothetical protein TsFJ059_005652 [Trichoderma semiorbis]|uniref:Uncharacterized protein n=1 Tax=Trichoderma semiorbis TaxID=1491008 RepID=A0A9P8KWK8_9HYPO|nr:hypothetical protein TsFJ059_005652 [Trichoderma semiorbis]
MVDSLSYQLYIQLCYISIRYIHCLRLIPRPPFLGYFIITLRFATIHREAILLLRYCHLHCFLLGFVPVTQFAEIGSSNVFERVKLGASIFEKQENFFKQLLRFHMAT